MAAPVLLLVFSAKTQVSYRNLHFIGVKSVVCDVEAKSVVVEGEDGLDLNEMLAKWVRVLNYFILFRANQPENQCSSFQKTQSE
jgi:hypothetical protein